LSFNDFNCIYIFFEKLTFLDSSRTLYEIAGAILFVIFPERKIEVAV
jgi:hypothetical protein